jgi:hypothetical protein
VKEKASPLLHLFLLGTLLWTAGLLNPVLYAADDSAQFKTRIVAPEVIIPEKIGQQYFSRHSVISDEFDLLENEQEQEARKKANEESYAAQDKLRRAEGVLKQAEENLQAAQESQKAEATKARDDAKEGRDDAQAEVKEAEDAKKKLDQLGKLPVQQFSLILNQAKVEKVAFTQNGPAPSDAKDTVFVRRNGKKLDLWIPQAIYNGYVTVQLSLGDKFSETYEIIVSKVNRWEVTGLAVAVTVAIFGLPILMIGTIKSSYTINGHPCTVWTVLFLDQETDTYSLSKFQFLVWTAVSLFGYVFLTLAKSLVQGTFAFSDLPENLPGIIAISAGTGVLASAITGAKGPKGAGQMDPSAADFITTGGLVVAERFQFFVWTLIGTLTFLFLILSSDPRGIKALPSIPPGFLQLMGISSLGYLGGKLARKAGPIIDDAAASTAATAPKLTLMIKGRKLSKTASFKIDGIDVELGKHQHKIDATAADADEQSSTPDFYKALKLAVDQPESGWLTTGSHTLVIINPDGQSAEWPFKV